jgi:type II secretory pathway component PulK
VIDSVSVELNSVLDVAPLAPVSLELSAIARGRRLAVVNALESARAAAAAESGIEHARAHLVRMIGEGGAGQTWNDPLSVLDPWHDAATAIHDSVTMDDGATYRTHVSDLGAMLNVNRVTEDELRAFLTAKAIDVVSVDGLAQAILDWRDADDSRRPHGAERDDYIKAGAREIPRNGPFESIDELRFVRGMTPAILSKIRGELTVFGSGQVNVNSAGPAVLASIPGITPLAVEIISQTQRRGRRIESVRQLTDLLPTQARTPFDRALVTALQRLVFDTHELLIRSDGWLAGSPVRVHEEAVIARGGNAAFLTWRRID